MTEQSSRFILAIALLACAAATGCDSRQSIEAARKQGRDAGFSRGYSAGSSIAKSRGYSDGLKSAYRSEVSQALASGKFSYSPPKLVFLVLFAFALGYVAQYGVFVFLRNEGWIIDLNRIVQSELATPELSQTQPTKDAD